MRNTSKSSVFVWKKYANFLDSTHPLTVLFIISYFILYIFLSIALAISTEYYKFYKFTIMTLSILGTFAAILIFKDKLFPDIHNVEIRGQLT
jgi:hypothetical protein